MNQSASRPTRTRAGVYALIRSQLSDGMLRPGMKLPSTRALASELAVSRTTVVAAYEQLAAEGYIETSAGANARVAAGIALQPCTPAVRPERANIEARLSAYGRRATALSLPQPANVGRNDIAMLYGALSPSDFPTLLWRRAYTRALLQRQERLYYGSSEGEPALRRELQHYLRRARGLVCTPEQVLIVHGSQQAIDLCARVLLDPGDAVVIEEPCYLMARRAFEAAGAALRAMPVDEHGMITRALPKGRAKLAYVTPSHQFPLGAVMSVSRRRELLAWAQRSGAWVIEDDYDGEFRYGLRPVESLQSLDEAGAVIYVGTFSKALSPQLRLGYLVLPLPLVAAFRQAKQLCDRHAPRLEQIVLASLIASGAYERHVRRLRRANERRRGTLIEAIARHLPASTRIEGAASGLHVVVWLEGVPIRDEATLVARARSEQVGVWPIGPLYATGRRARRCGCAGLVIGYAGLEPAAIEAGVRRLARALEKV